MELLNNIFDRHGVKNRLQAHAGQPHSTWTQVAKGLHRLSVELDDAAVVSRSEVISTRVYCAILYHCVYCILYYMMLYYSTLYYMVLYCITYISLIVI